MVFLYFAKKVNNFISSCAFQYDEIILYNYSQVKTILVLTQIVIFEYFKCNLKSKQQSLCVKFYDKKEENAPHR